MIKVIVIVVLVLMIIYLIIGIAQIFLVITKVRKSTHAWCSIAGTVILGLGMFTYRLLNGLKTSIAKFIHMFIMLIGVGCIGAAMGLLKLKDKASNNYDSIHRYPGYIICDAIVLQVVIALIVFICCYNSRTRYYVAPFHDMFGIWIYIVLVGCCIGATHKWSGLDREIYANDLVFSMLLTSMANVVIVLVLVLSPYFEWDIVF